MSGGEEERNDVLIREARADDHDVVERLRFSVGWMSPDTGLAAMARGLSKVYILEMSGKPVASGALVYKGDDDDLADSRERGLISNLIVDPAYQGRGLGSRMLHFLEERAREQGYAQVTIGVDAVNTGARRLYQREGYRRLKDKLEAWGEVNYLYKPLEPIPVDTA